MKQIITFLLAAWLMASSCSPGHYSSADFRTVPKSDVHVHLNTARDAFTRQAMDDGFRLLTINVNSGVCEKVAQQFGFAMIQKREHPGMVDFAATFCMDGFGTRGWVENTISWIDSCTGSGAVAVKIWKNIGMEFRDTAGNLVMIDDRGFDPVFRHLAGMGIPVVGHLGEPKNCWLPLEEMTTKNDSSYFAGHPEYHMHLHPEMPSYEAQIAARDRMLEKNPGLVFIGCHLGSLEWSIGELARFLDRFPDAAVDMSARMGQLFYQTRENRGNVRRFFIDYQDRLLYGTDTGDDGETDPEVLKKELHATWLRDWEYLTTDHLMTSNLVEGEFRGLKLPKEVVDKVFYRNAMKWYGLK